MEVVGWTLAAFFALLALFLGMRRKPAGRAEAEGRGPGAVVDGTSDAEDRPTVTGDEVLSELARYLESAVTGPLEEGLRAGEVEAAVEDAIDALSDLIDFGRARVSGSRTQEDLLSVLQDVTREYSLETGTPVKLSAPDAPVIVVVEAEPFKDAIYLLLSNAGRFGRGQTVEVLVESRDGAAQVAVRDRGPGFSGEALYRAFRPFWSSESDALGLGLPQARKLVEEQGGTLRIGNRPEGGGEVVVSIPIARRGS